MSLVHIDKNPSASLLRWFGLSVAAVLGILGLVFFLRFGAVGLAMAFWVVGAAYLAVYYGVRRWQRTLYLGWMFATAPLAFCLSHAVLLTIYFGVVAPMGLVMRLFGYDPLRRRRHLRQAESFWVGHESDKALERYFTQY